MVSFSVNLRKLRLERQLSQKQAAAILGISQALLSHYEKGIRECGLEFVAKAARFYGVSADYLLGLTNEKNTEGASVFAVRFLRLCELFFSRLGEGGTVMLYNYLNLAVYIASKPFFEQEVAPGAVYKAYAPDRAKYSEIVWSNLITAFMQLEKFRTIPLMGEKFDADQIGAINRMIEDAEAIIKPT